MDIFEVTVRPKSEYFFTSYDENDIRLGSIVRSEPEDYHNCKYVLLGSPQDIGVKRNRGRVGASKAPNEIRKVLYKMAFPSELEEKGFFDLGNILVSGSLEDIHDLQYQVVKKLLEDGKLPIVLGGGNDVSYPDARAVSSVFDEIAVVNIDNHFDVRYNEERNSGTPYRMLLEEGHLLPKNFIEMGCQKPANSYHYRKYLDEKGVQIIYFDNILNQGLESILDQIKSRFFGLPIFWGYDMDSVKASDAPGVSAITPIGLSGEDAVQIAKFAGSFKSTKLFEISEVNPEFDIDSRTTRLASLMIIHFIWSNLFVQEQSNE